MLIIVLCVCYVVIFITFINMVRGLVVRRRRARPRPTMRSVQTARFNNRRTASLLQNIRTSGLLNVEQKYRASNWQQIVSQDIGAATTAAMNTNALLNDIPRGDGPTECVGQKYAITSLHLQGVVEFAATIFAGPGGGLSPIARIMIVIDHQNNGNVAAEPHQCYDNPASPYDVFTTRNINNMKRFTVLRDLTVEKGSCGLTWNTVTANYVTQAKSVSWSYYHKFKKPLIVTRDAATTTGVRSAVRDNCIDIYAISQDSASLIAYRSRIRFTDS